MKVVQAALGAFSRVRRRRNQMLDRRVYIEIYPYKINYHLTVYY